MMNDQIVLILHFGNHRYYRFILNMNQSQMFGKELNSAMTTATEEDNIPVNKATALRALFMQKFIYIQRSYPEILATELRKQLRN